MTNARAIAFVALACAAATCGAPRAHALSTGVMGQHPGAGDPDADGDGLSDFHEVHKYFTDPGRADTDGDGISDGDWSERREHAYSLRTITHVLRPITPDILCDDYQDARVLDETDSYVELEVVAYPLNTVASAIIPDANWRATAASMPEWTRSGPTSNWDAAMRDAIVAGLKNDGIDAMALSDKELVERATPWLLKHANYQDGFSTFCSSLEAGQVRVHPGLEEAARNAAAGSGLTIQEQWERELFAKGMFDHALRGSCTSSAIYLNGCLRALGIPTRIVLAVPIIDGTDSTEPPMIDRLRNNIVRSTIQEGTENLGQGWSSHTFNEVFVGGRWRRLNYDRLGQNILDPHYFGLMIHVATFSDWTDGNMAATWGMRQLRDDRPDDVFGGSNPYSTIAISDRFGAHGSQENPPPPSEFATLTIDSAVWYHERPKGLEMSNMRELDTAGHLFVHVAEGDPSKGTRQYKQFYRSVAKGFMLRSPGKLDVPLAAERGYWIDPDHDLKHFYLRIAPEAFAAMEPGVRYTLEPASSDASCRWAVRPDVTIVKPTVVAAAAPPVAALPVAPDAGGIPETITITRAVWSDASSDTAGMLQQLGPVILIHVGHDSAFLAFKRFCEAADRTFVLESPGKPSVRATAAIGGVTIDQQSHGLLMLEESSWKDLTPGADYTLRPVNAVPGHAWVVAEGITCRR